MARRLVSPVPQSSLSRRRPSALDVARQTVREIGSLASRGPRRLGTAVGTAIVSPFENRRLRKEQQTADLLADVGRRRRARGATSGRFDRSAQRITQGVANQQRRLAERQKLAERQAVTGGIETALTALGGSGGFARAGTGRLAGLGASAIGRTGITAGIGTALGSAFAAPKAIRTRSAEPFRQALVQGVGRAPVLSGINTLTTPVASKIVGKFAPTSLKARFSVGGTVNSIANVIEDEILKQGEEGRWMNNNEKIQSALTGFFIGGATQLKPGKQAKIKSDASAKQVVGDLKKSVPGQIELIDARAKSHYKEHLDSIFKPRKKYSMVNANAVRRAADEFETTGKLTPSSRREAEELFKGHNVKTQVEKMSDEFLTTELFHQVKKQFGDQSGGFVKPDEFLPKGIKARLDADAKALEVKAIVSPYLYLYFSVKY